MLQHAATHCNTLHQTATHCNVSRPSVEGKRVNILQHSAARCNTLQHIATCHVPALKGSGQHTATHRNTLQHTATHLDPKTSKRVDTPCCNTLQHTLIQKHQSV